MPAHAPGGSVQTPEAQEPPQQLELVVQEPPVGVSPLSMDPLQSLSMPSQTSVASGFTVGSVSSQSEPPHASSPKPSMSASRGVKVHEPSVFEHPSTVHASKSLQLGAVPAWQTPGSVVDELQVSTPLQ
jgi:hypothetical protein